MDDIMEESVEQDPSMEHSRDEIALDMLASANSDEFTPELVAISKAQAQVEQAEEKTLEYVSSRFLLSISTLFTALCTSLFLSRLT